MMYIKYLNLLVLVLLCSCACNKSDENSNTNATEDPSNLEFVADVAMDGSGRVTLTATATNAVRYEFYMGDNGPNEPYQNTTGVYEHIYETLGTYQIEVRAYGTSGRFVKKTTQLAVQSDAPVAVGEGYTTPTQYEGMNLVWNDEFEGNFLNTSNWTHEIGTGCPNCGWGNAELQYYRSENTTVGDGVLTIEARQEAFQGSAYTSSRLISKDKQAFQYGRIDVRALLPKGQGIWPALWMLGDNISSVSWPACGEIDIMELVGGAGRDNEVHGTCHWDDNGHQFTGEGYQLNSGIFADEFHVFSIIWDAAKIQFLVDDNLYNTFSITESTRSEFKNEFFFIMNIAVGGNWPGAPDNTTVFPQQIQVDYIRVFQ